MARFPLLVCLSLLTVATLVACQPEAVNYPATIEALNATIAALEQSLPVSSPGPVEPTTSPPTATATARPLATVRLATPRPITTVQRPPTLTPSATASPLPTPTATATPLPDAQVGEWPTNLRSGPAVGYAILAEVAGGTPLDVLGKSPDGEWLKVRLPTGLEGWMFYLPVELNIPLDTIPVTE